ncbi:C-GCAxxG-C-C family (seleno)protein, partial [Clostridioides difficile]
MTRPSIYHSQGYTCAEALIKSYNEEHNTDIPISIGSGMGVGMNVGSVCGAVNAAVVIIGYLNGRNSNLDEKGTPYVAIIATMLITIPIALSGSFAELAAIS